MISYIGGKFRMTKWITQFIPKNIETYVEPFSGMFWIFFGLNLQKFPNLKNVVYNDLNKLNANLYKCIKDYDRLYDELSKYPCQTVGVTNTPKEYSEMFYQFQKEVFHPDLEITDEPNFEIACKYVYVMTQVFSGSKPEKAKYMDYKGKYRCKVLIFMDKLKNQNYRNHIDKINFVKSDDFEKVITDFDSETTFFYVDPPYYKTEHYYSNHNYSFGDHYRLANSLKPIKGKFCLSYYDFDDLNKWYPHSEYVWDKKKFSKAASAKTGVKQNMGTEVIIMNYK